MGDYGVRRAGSAYVKKGGCRMHLRAWGLVFLFALILTVGCMVAYNPEQGRHDSMVQLEMGLRPDATGAQIEALAGKPDSLKRQRLQMQVHIDNWFIPEYVLFLVAIAWILGRRGRTAREERLPLTAFLLTGCIILAGLLDFFGENPSLAAILSNKALPPWLSTFKTPVASLWYMTRFKWGVTFLSCAWLAHLCLGGQQGRFWIAGLTSAFAATGIFGVMAGSVDYVGAAFNSMMLSAVALLAWMIGTADEIDPEPVWPWLGAAAVLGALMVLGPPRTFARCTLPPSPSPPWSCSPISFRPS